MASGYRRIKGRTELRDIELGSTAATTGGKRAIPARHAQSSKRSLTQALQQRLWTFWDESIAASAPNDDPLTDAGNGVVVVSFIDSGSGSLRVQSQTYDTCTEIQHLLKSNSSLGLAARLIILPPAGSFRLSQISASPLREAALLARIRLLASIVASIGYNIDPSSRTQFLQLAGVEDTFSDLQAALDILQLADFSSDQNHVWDFEHYTTTITPTVYDSDYALYTSTFSTQPPGQRWLRSAWHKGHAGNLAVQHIIVACNDTAADDPNGLYRRFVNSFVSGSFQTVNSIADIREAVLQQAYAAVDQETAENLVLLAQSIYEMKYLVRREPSRLKFNFILHLQDHLEVLSQTLRKRVPHDMLLTHLSNGGNTSHKIEKTRDDKAGTANYAVHLLAAVLTLQQTTNEVYESVKVQVGNRDSAKNKLLAVLAAVYLPFTLASGILGMNVVELSEPNNVEWPIFVAIGLPLVAATVALPLSFDWLTRVVRRFGIRRPRGLRRLWCLVVSVLIFGVVVVAVTIPVLVTRRR